MKNNQEITEYQGKKIYQHELDNLEEIIDYVNTHGNNNIDWQVSPTHYIESLDLPNNELQNLPEEIFVLSELKTLNLSGNHLEELPDAISNLQNLSELDLSDNDFNMLDDTTDLPSQLGHLNLSGNHLEEFPGAISNLKHLKILLLSENDFNMLDDTIDLPSQLWYLNLSGNHLEEFPGAISKLKNLVWLNLSGNHLEELPDSISKLHKLKRLDLSENQLVNIPTEVWRFLANKFSSKKKAGLLQKMLFRFIDTFIKIKENSQLERYFSISDNDFSYNYLIEKYYGTEHDSKKIKQLINGYKREFFGSPEDLRRFEEKRLVDLTYVRQEHKMGQKFLLNLANTIARSFYTLLLGTSLIKHYKAIFSVQIGGVVFFISAAFLTIMFFSIVLIAFWRHEIRVKTAKDDFVSDAIKDDSITPQEFSESLKTGYFNMIVDMRAARYNLIQGTLFNVIIAAGGAIFLTCITINANNENYYVYDSILKTLTMIGILALLLFVVCSQWNSKNNPRERNNVRKEIISYKNMYNRRREEANQ